MGLLWQSAAIMVMDETCHKWENKGNYWRHQQEILTIEVHFLPSLDSFWQNKEVGDSEVVKGLEGMHDSAAAESRI